MRILFLSAEYPPNTDGIGAYVGSIAPGLAERGHEVHVLSCVPGQRVSEENDRGVLVHRRPCPAVPRLALALGLDQLGEHIAQAVACGRELRRLRPRPDVIEAPDWLAEGLLAPRPMVAHLHTPVLLTTRYNGKAFDRDHRAADRLERAAVRRADVVTAPSQLLVDTLRSEGWLPSGLAVQVIGYPVDIDQWLDVQPVERTRPVVLAVGRLERRKAPEILLAACARLVADIPDLELVFLGRSSGRIEGRRYDAWLRQEAERLGVRCTFVGHLPRHELGEWYSRARVVATPSRYDNFPMVTLEALACGRPVVCTDRIGTAPLIGPSGAGSIVPVGDAATLAVALRGYLVDRDVAAKAGRIGREVAQRHCSPAAVAEARERWYQEAITSPKHRRLTFSRTSWRRRD